MSNQPSRVAFFIRSATGNLADLRSQRKFLEKELMRRGFDTSLCSVEIYQDAHQSGLRHGPEFQRMSSDVADGKIDVVMVARMNRISRSLPELMKFTRFVANHRIRFISAHENVDSSYWTSTKNAEGF
jgi:DNA invertase Pin-like site-specific DNA recombinase